MEHKETNAFDVLLQIVEVCGKSLERPQVDISAEVRLQLREGMEKINVVINNNNHHIEMKEEIHISHSQVGAAGSHAVAHDNSFNQHNKVVPELDFEKLTAELEAVKQALLARATTPEQFTALAQISHAEAAAKEKDGNKLWGYLKEFGKWALDAATETGAHLLAEILKTHFKL